MFSFYTLTQVRHGDNSTNPLKKVKICEDCNQLNPVKVFRKATTRSTISFHNQLDKNLNNLKNLNQTIYIFNHEFWMN